MTSGEKRKQKGTGLKNHYENRKSLGSGAKQRIEERVSLGIRVGVRGVG